TPTSASWMTAVEGFFSKLSRQRLKHAIFNSLDECIAAIEGCIEHHNANDARPFRWSKAPEDLVEAWKKGHQKLQESAS
ncbi:MAG: IS630 family transposase, partial [Rhodobacteraceae bacterium]|nr:IS630 family transposase [Paracoccaceae bacterium]